MQILTQSLSEGIVAGVLAARTPAPSVSIVPDHDIPEIAARFSRAEMRGTERSAQSVSSLLAERSSGTKDFNTTTYADVTFLRVDPLRETQVVADERLQRRLEALCETLRAKY